MHNVTYLLVCFVRLRFKLIYTFIGLLILALFLYTQIIRLNHIKMGTIIVLDLLRCISAVKTINDLFL